MRLLYTMAFPLVLLSGCTNHSDIRLQAVYNSFVSCNNIIAEENDMIKTRLSQKLQDPQTMSRAQIWQPTAMAVFTASNNTLRFLDSMQTGSSVAAFANSSTGLSQLLIGIKDSIRQNLRPENFPENPYVAASVNARRNQFMKTLLTDISFDSTRGVFIDKNTPSYFKEESLLEAKLMTERIRNEVLVATRSVLLFCDQNTNTNDDRYEVFSTVITKNSDNLSAGQELIITGGMGTFSSAMRPVFTIAGRNIEPGEDGLVTYSLMIHQPPGEYKIPVSVKYVAPDGRTLIKESFVRYRVINTPK